MAVLAPAAPFVLDAETVGLILLLVVCFFAITIIDATRPGIVRTAGAVPLVGLPLKSWVDGAFGSARGWLYNTMKGGLVAFSATVDWLHNTAAQLADTLAGLGELTWTAVWKIQAQALPALEARVLAVGAAAGARLRSEVLALVSAQEAAWRAEAAGITQLVYVAEQEAGDYTRAAVGAMGASLQRQIADAEAIAQGATQALGDSLQRQIADAESGIQAAVVGLGLSLEAQVADAEAIFQSGASALEREVADAQGALARLVAVLTAAGALVGAGVITDALADVRNLKNSRCQQHCDTLGDLGQFAEALDVAALIAFALAWRQDQASAHPVFGPTIAATVSDLEQGVKSVIGG